MIQVKNWELFQHFKDRKPPWIKLYRDLLDDLEWHELDGESAKILVMIWLIASETENGQLPPAKELSFRLRISIKSLESTVSKLSHWLIQNDIKMISKRYQIDTLETETETETERETETDTRPVHRGRKPTKPHCIPEDFAPNESGVIYAQHKRLDLETEVSSFRNYWQGCGTARRDWQATWKSWCDKAVEFGRQVKRGGKVNGSRQDHLANVAAELTGRNQGERTIDGTAIEVGRETLQPPTSDVW